MRYAFIGHFFHERSKSTKFFQEILQDLGEVEFFTADPDADAAENDKLIDIVMNRTYDCIILLQTEFIAERLLRLIRCRVIVIPMYDGAFSRNDIFWKRLVGVRFISFCRTHHEHLKELDCESASFQYFPPLSPRLERETSRRNAFFWERRPDLAINLAVVLDLCRQLEITELHVHAAPDFVRIQNTSRRRITQAGPVSLTWSTWFDQQEDYKAAATAPLFFFAPRLREGIGMASLEAMSAGQIVVAPDHPSINEYVSHATSGILYDPQNPQIELSLNEAALLSMSAAARQKAEIGRFFWLGDIDRLKSLLLHDGRRWSTDDASSSFVNELRAAASRRVFDGGAYRPSEEATA